MNTEQGRANLDMRTCWQSNLLRYCFKQGPANVDAIGTLVELGADTSAVTEANSLETPLHIAARSGRVDIVHKLIKCHVDLLSRTKVSHRILLLDVRQQSGFADILSRSAALQCLCGVPFVFAVWKSTTHTRQLTSSCVHAMIASAVY